MSQGSRYRTETLEALIRRVTTDARAVNAPMTPEILATAILAGGWQHGTGRGLAILIARHWPVDPKELAAVLAAHGWKHPRSPHMNAQARRGTA